MNQETLDNLEVAKLATLIGSQLRVVDQQMDGVNTPANRLDPKKFIQNVVNSTKQGVPVPQYNSTAKSDEESRLLEFLNSQAMQQIPDTSVYSNPPVVTQTQPQITPHAEPVPNINPAYVVNNPPSVPQVPPQPNYARTPQFVDNGQVMLDISNTLKSIDESIKALCGVFVQKHIKKKKKRVQSAKKRLIQEKESVTSEIPTTSNQQPLTPIAQNVQ